MNSTVLVLVIAGVCVIAGIALIVVAIMLGRKEREAEADGPDSSEAGARGTRGGRTFIDDPLETDLGSQLGKENERPATPDGTHHAEGDAPAGSARRSAVGRGQAREGWDPETIPEPIRTGGSGPRKASYDFSVQLAYRALTVGEFTRTIAELRKAFALTDDPEARTELLIEIGNSSRMAEDYPTARAAYQEAITYSTDPLVWDNLHDWIEEMAYQEAAAPAPAETGETGEPETEGPEAVAIEEADADGQPAEVAESVEDDDERGA